MRTENNDFIILLDKKVKIKIIDTITKDFNYLKELKLYSEDLLNAILIFMCLKENDNNNYVWTNGIDIYVFDKEGNVIKNDSK